MAHRSPHDRAHLCAHRHTDERSAAPSMRELREQDSAERELYRSHSAEGPVRCMTVAFVRVVLST